MLNTNIKIFIENKYHRYYYIINSTISLLFYNQIYLCYDKIEKINNPIEYINSNKSVKLNDLPDIFKEYIIENYPNYELGIIINNEIDEIYDIELFNKYIY